MSTLLYLASGIYNPEYEKLPFRKMIFVDRCGGHGKTYPRNDKRIRFIEGDALEAIHLLRSEGVRIDCLVTVNEGLYEGGGSYPILSDFLMGYLSTILQDMFTLICNLNYYCSKYRGPMRKLDWGFEVIEKVHRKSACYIAPSLFSYSQRIQSDPDYGDVLLMQRNREVHCLNLIDVRTQVNIVHGSIWDDVQSLDLLGLNLLSKHPLRNRSIDTTVKTFFSSIPKVLDIQGMSFEEILEICRDKNVRRIGLTPWQKGDYDNVIERLRLPDVELFESITFYHLNKNDYKSIKNKIR